mmetsp:Transcript_24123/g.50422  ORF Transcript_24123/g.50422 Transcript_24123/m.50422 type:complete len:204 (+) Transcript_24123:1-612(+)
MRSCSRRSCDSDSRAARSALPRSSSTTLSWLRSSMLRRRRLVISVSHDRLCSRSCIRKSRSPCSRRLPLAQRSKSERLWLSSMRWSLSHRRSTISFSFRASSTRCMKVWLRTLSSEFSCCSRARRASVSRSVCIRAMRASSSRFCFSTSSTRFTTRRISSGSCSWELRFLTRSRDCILLSSSCTTLSFAPCSWNRALVSSRRA